MKRLVTYDYIAKADDQDAIALFSIPLKGRKDLRALGVAMAAFVACYGRVPEVRVWSVDNPGQYLPIGGFQAGYYGFELFDDEGRSLEGHFTVENYYNEYLYSVLEYVSDDPVTVQEHGHWWRELATLPGGDRAGDIICFRVKGKLAVLISSTNESTPAQGLWVEVPETVTEWGSLFMSTVRKPECLFYQLNGRSSVDNCPYALLPLFDSWWHAVTIDVSFGFTSSAFAWWADVVNYLTRAIASHISAVFSSAHDLIGAAWQYMQDEFDAFKEMLSEFFDDVKDFFENVFNRGVLIIKVGTHLTDVRYTVTPYDPEVV